MPNPRRVYLCNICEEGSTSTLYGICDECANAVGKAARLSREAEAVSKSRIEPR